MQHQTRHKKLLTRPSVSLQPDKEKTDYPIVWLRPRRQSKVLESPTVTATAQLKTNTQFQFLLFKSNWPPDWPESHTQQNSFTLLSKPRAASFCPTPSCTHTASLKSTLESFTTTLLKPEINTVNKTRRFKIKKATEENLEGKTGSVWLTSNLRSFLFEQQCLLSTLSHNSHLWSHTKSISHHHGP